MACLPTAHAINRQWNTWLWAQASEKRLVDIGGVHISEHASITVEQLYGWLKCLHIKPQNKGAGDFSLHSVEIQTEEAHALRYQLRRVGEVLLPEQVLQMNMNICALPVDVPEGQATTDREYHTYFPKETIGFLEEIKISQMIVEGVPNDVAAEVHLRDKGKCLLSGVTELDKTVVCWIIPPELEAVHFMLESEESISVADNVITLEKDIAEMFKDNIWSIDVTNDCDIVILGPQSKEVYNSFKGYNATAILRETVRNNAKMRKIMEQHFYRFLCRHLVECDRQLDGHWDSLYILYHEEKDKGQSERWRETENTEIFLNALKQGQDVGGSALLEDSIAVDGENEFENK